MTEETIKKQFIHKKLSKIKNLWYPKPNQNKVQAFNSANCFLTKIKKEKPDLSINPKLKPYQITYNTSLMHFFLYYTYKPKQPFIISRKNTIIFGAFKGRNHNKIEISFPVTPNAKSALKKLNKILLNTYFKSIIKENNIKTILLRDIDNNYVNLLRNNKKQHKFQLESLSELKYSTYKIDKTLNLNGNEYSNLRWHLNSFKKDKHNIKAVPLNQNVKPVIHLIGQWRGRSAKHRDFSYINVKSDKLGARLLAKKQHFLQDRNHNVEPRIVISRVLMVDDIVSAFNLGFPLGIYDKQPVFAHAIGIADISIPHLSEYAQYDFWKQIQKAGYHFVNDGPTWRESLEIYKDKFRPIKKKRYYWANLSINV